MTLHAVTTIKKIYVGCDVELINGSFSAENIPGINKVFYN